jgi:hypothetical protein
MSSAKQGPAFPGHTLELDLQRSLWLLDGRNSDGEKLPEECHLELAHVELELLLLESR